MTWKSYWKELLTLKTCIEMKCIIPDTSAVIIGAVSDIVEKEDLDYPEIIVILQKRWEEPDGSVHALRVGTAIQRIEENIPTWINDYEMKIEYGDITKRPFYKNYMGLKTNPETADHARNSQGKNVIIQEDGWAAPGTEPTHLIVLFLTSCGEAFYGGVGNTLWIDNVELVM